jgi:hypothetical protein
MDLQTSDNAYPTANFQTYSPRRTDDNPTTVGRPSEQFSILTKTRKTGRADRTYRADRRVCEDGGRELQ